MSVVNIDGYISPPKGYAVTFLKGGSLSSNDFYLRISSLGEGG